MNLEPSGGTPIQEGGYPAYLLGIKNGVLVPLRMYSVKRFTL